MKFPQSVEELLRPKATVRTQPSLIEKVSGARVVTVSRLRLVVLFVSFLGFCLLLFEFGSLGDGTVNKMTPQSRQPVVDYKSIPENTSTNVSKTVVKATDGIIDRVAANSSLSIDNSSIKLSDLVKRGKAPLLIGIGSVHSASTTTFFALDRLFHMRNSFTEIGVYGNNILNDRSLALRKHWIPHIQIEGLSGVSETHKYFHNHLAPYRLQPEANGSNDNAGVEQLSKQLATVCPLLEDFYANGYCFDMNALLSDRRNDQLRTDLLFCANESQTRKLVDWDRTSDTEDVLKNGKHSLPHYMGQWKSRKKEKIQVTADDFERIPEAYKAQFNNASGFQNLMKEPLSGGPKLAVTKTTAYYMHPHTAWIFAREYAHNLETRFIWNVRDPLKRIWAVGRHWHTYALKARRRLKGRDCEFATAAMCEDAFRVNQLKTMNSIHVLVSALTAAEELGFGGTVTNDDLIALWIQLYYNKPQILKRDNALFSSIYYIPLLFWRRAFEQFGVEFRRSHFRVLQSQWITRDVDFAMNTIRCFAMTGIGFDLRSEQPSQRCPFAYRMGVNSLHTVSSHRWDGEMTAATRRLLFSAYAVPNALMDLQMQKDPTLFLGTWTSWNKAYGQSQGRNETWLSQLFNSLNLH